MATHRNDGWDSEKKGSDMQSGRQFDYSAIPQTLEELELENKREAMELARSRDKEEDEENYKHREVWTTLQFWAETKRNKHFYFCSS